MSKCTPKKFYEIDLRLDKHSSSIQTLVITAVKGFITFGPGTNVIKLFTTVNYEFSL